MEKITIDEIIEACDGKLLQGDLNTQIDKISTDTRTLKKEHYLLH